MLRPPDPSQVTLFISARRAIGRSSRNPLPPRRRDPNLRHITGAESAAIWLTWANRELGLFSSSYIWESAGSKRSPGSGVDWISQPCDMRPPFCAAGLTFSPPLPIAMGLPRLRPSEEQQTDGPLSAGNPSSRRSSSPNYKSRRILTRRNCSNGIRVGSTHATGDRSPTPSTGNQSQQTDEIRSAESLTSSRSDTSL